MRLLRLRLRNYRGIVDREIVPSPTGVTVIAGPNEIGKTSLAEAIDLLFDELDSTTKQRVRDVQPVDRDEGAEIEVDVLTGPYAFTYAKRFQRRATTRLVVTRPTHEHWTGREAHQRVREILDETIDTELWRALRVQQGEGLEQASWLGRPALAAALDRAAGAAAAGAEEESLFEAAETEYGRYFTPTGRPRRDRTSAEREALQARAEAESLETALRHLEVDVQRAAELRAERARCDADVARAEADLREQERGFEPIAALRESLQTAEARRDAALAEEREGIGATRQRGQLVASYAAAEADLAQRSEEMERGEPALLGARAELEHAERGLAAARSEQDRIGSEDRRRRAALELQRAEQDLAASRERIERIAAAARAVGEVRDELAASPIDDDAVERIALAERAVLKALARVESEGPLVRVTPHAEVEAEVDGRRTRLEPGHELERRITESFAMTLPGVADITVVAGAGAASRLKVLEEKRTHWRTLCTEHGALDHAGAVAARTARRDAERRLAERTQHLAELRGADDDASLAAHRQQLEERLATLAAQRDPQLSLPSEPLPATTLDASDAALERAQRAFDEALQRRELLAERHQKLAEQHRETAVRLDLAEQSFAAIDTRLAQARSERADEALERQRDSRAALARTLENESREIRERLLACDPDAAEAALAAARRLREAVARALARVREEAIEVGARLALRGEAGLFEQVERADAEALRAERAERALTRRAEAARILFEALGEERDAAREGYAAPLRARIEELGRTVFGDRFEVELDEELRVARRIHDGVALDFGQLSAGAREQIALIAKLACATLVGDEGGAPVILDDALGHSDPERLARMGRTLSLAAPFCQLLVLTCTPERYRHVEGARVVQLR